MEIACFDQRLPQMADIQAVVGDSLFDINSEEDWWTCLPEWP